MGDSELGTAADDELTVDELEEWLQSGATWRVIDIAAVGAAVQFRTCTGTALEIRRTTDPAVITYLRTAHPELE
jgi:anti-sigma-K factor RskA